jgi:2-dehydropantoate 2-reductase
LRSITHPLKFLSFGAGAIGTYIGGSLALAGHQVVFVERPEVAIDLKTRGLRLDLSRLTRRKGESLPPNIDYSAVEIRESVLFTASLDEALTNGPFDAALFALKSYDTAAALEGMKPHAERLPPILCLQNGVDNEPAIAAALGADKVIYGTVTTAIGRKGAGDIVVERLRGMGVADGHPLSRALAAALSSAHLNARSYPNAADMKWSKMLTNLLANASSAILDMPAAEIFSQPALFDMEMRMLREALAVISALRIHVVDLPGTPVRALAWGARLPAALARPLMVRAVGGGRGGKMPSFHIDLHSGRKVSEVDYLNGAVVRAGKKAGVPTPVNKYLTQTLLALTRGDLPLESYARQPQRLLSAAGAS